MRKMRFTLAILAVLSFGFALQAKAYPTLDQGNNQLILAGGWESGFPSSWLVSTGTIFAGVFNISQIINGSGVTTYKNTWAGDGFLTGVFMAQVSTNPVTQQTSVFELAPVDFASSQMSAVNDAFKELFGTASGGGNYTKDKETEMLKIYWTPNDPGIDQNFSTAPLQYLDSASSMLWASMAIKDGGSDFFEARIDPAYVGVFPPVNTAFGKLQFELSSTEGYTTQELLGNAGGWELATATTAGMTLKRVNQSGDYQVLINDSAEVYATPEPATMMIMGAGLLGLFGLRRRQKSN